MMPVEFGFKEYDEMQCINRTRQQRAEFAARERAAFSKIPGMTELLRTPPESETMWSAAFPMQRLH